MSTNTDCSNLEMAAENFILRYCANSNSHKVHILQCLQSITYATFSSQSFNRTEI